MGALRCAVVPDRPASHARQAPVCVFRLVRRHATVGAAGGLWLFPGGHVDDGEDPRTTALREAAEELRITGEFHPRFGDEPLFLTVTKTRGEHSHTDVSFWFVLNADQDMRIEADPREANQARWFALDDPAEWAHDRFDPHMARFRDKLAARLGSPALVG